MPRKRSAPTDAFAQQNDRSHQQAKRQKITHEVNAYVQDNQPTYNEPNYQTFPTLPELESDTATEDGYDTPNDVDNDILFVNGKKYSHNDLERRKAAYEQRQLDTEERKAKLQTASEEDILNILNAPTSTWGEVPTEADKQAWRDLRVFNRPYFWELEGGMMAFYQDKDLKAKRCARKQAAIDKEEESARLVAAAEGLTQLRRSTRAPKPSNKANEISRDLSMVTDSPKASSKSRTRSPPAAEMEIAGQKGTKKVGKSPKSAKRPSGSDNDQSAAEMEIAGQKGKRKGRKSPKSGKGLSSRDNDQLTPKGDENGEHVSFKISLSTKKRAGFILKLKVKKPQ